MKQLLIAISALLAVTVSLAQNTKYETAMKGNLQKLENAATPNDLAALAAGFERIGDAEKTQWLPYYYAALATITNGFTDPNADKEKLATMADALLAKAESIAPNNSEIFVLKGMAATIHMLVDPMNRWQQYGGLIRENISLAKQANGQNPRIYLFEGQNLMGTPVQFGGGREAARPLIEKSVALYQTYKPAGDLLPNWGKQQAEKLLENTK